MSAHDDAGSSKQPQLPLRRSRGHNDARSAGFARPLERGVLIVPSHDARGALQRAQGLALWGPKIDFRLGPDQVISLRPDLAHFFWYSC